MMWQHANEPVKSLPPWKVKENETGLQSALSGIS